MLINPTKLILDLRKVSLDKAPADVFRCLNHAAEALASKDFTTVELQFRGKPKFLLEGSYFKTLGQEYELQNPVYTIRTFPENVKNMDGTAAFSSWSGGMLGVLQKQMEDFLEFNKQWYVNELSEQ
ncbi:MAG TPA: hypothetical protein VNL73_01025 [Verrucomicrobiae bacterium]|nr:hypothetical protein [Verrucomicrobiae bacterium]